VDTRTEVLIQEAMARLRRGRTSFVIAHRLSTIRNADTIVVMDNGRIVEQGSHHDGGPSARPAAMGTLMRKTNPHHGPADRQPSDAV
jgi:ABC-type transport system involved in cytochrome bd biosynthesis fused ATPase/permease subunit